MLIRNKLILRFTLLVVGIQLCFSIFIYYFQASNREQRFVNRLAGKAAMTARVLLHRDSINDELLRTLHRRDLFTVPGEQISIYGPGHHLLYTSADGLSQKLNSFYLPRIKPSRPVQFRDGQLETIGLYYERNGRPYWIFAAGHDDFGHRQMVRLWLILLAANLGALVLIILAGWYFADESLKPISRIIAQVERITATQLSTRVDEGNGTDEIAQLARTFNHMLGGVEQAFESQKSFLSNASHELRTPLASVLGTLETSYAYDTDLAEAKHSIGSATEEIKKLIELTNGLLSLAKVTDASFRRDLVRLDECLAQAIASCEKRHPGRSIKQQFGQLPPEVEDMFMVRGNEQLLTTALLNLLDNACKYSQDGVQALLSYPSTDAIEVKITDTGIGMEPHELARIYEPLYRAGTNTTAPGYGIGLPMTRKIVLLHGGQIQLTSVVGKGTTASVKLPAATAGPGL
ncbi:HAMP domain-containing protein [Hymenobacter taeanensis]|uniref:histidine kinase n=1 Tax=Hymenobacter taeanensis TaxID=2735321 RepID=A0A6M6BLW2_9BACT|nr:MULTISPECIES: ATP-binding protein [Hymenobacter]QJX48967.1 HAMP domain-containing protein [Hymenobacter taeanensis]UOQ81518.1 ATP-binding protein [Hymenobacter sp. 5414T-23]